MIYELDTKGRFIGDIPSDDPDGLHDWTRQESPSGLWRPYIEGTRLSSGEWVGEWKDAGPAPIPPETLKLRERFWRDGELRAVDFRINAIEDNGQDASEWRAYRQALRDYPTSTGFSTGKRPKSPVVA